jgi:RNase H-like domain found in reverse transcriptase
LEGHSSPIEIWTDHQNLTYFKSTQKLIRRQARWSLYLTHFNFILKHKPGKTILVADPLFRRPDHEEGVKLDNADKILLKPEYFKLTAIDSSHDAPINDDEILREIKKALLDDEVTKNYKTLLKSVPREFGKTLDEWNYENGLLLYRGKIYVPKDKDEQLRRKVTYIHYDLLLAGHLGRWKTYELLT